MMRIKRKAGYAARDYELMAALRRQMYEAAADAPRRIDAVLTRRSRHRRMEQVLPAGRGARSETFHRKRAPVRE